MEMITYAAQAGNGSLKWIISIYQEESAASKILGIWK